MGVLMNDTGERVESCGTNFESCHAVPGYVPSEEATFSLSLRTTGHQLSNQLEGTRRHLYQTYQKACGNPLFIFQDPPLRSTSMSNHADSSSQVSAHTVTSLLILSNLICQCNAVCVAC